MEEGRGEKRQRKEGEGEQKRGGTRPRKDQEAEKMGGATSADMRDIKIPHEFFCPISRKVMRDLVILPVVERALVEACSEKNHVHRLISSSASSAFELMGYSLDRELKRRIDVRCFDNRRDRPEPISPRTADRLVQLDKWGYDGSSIPTYYLCPVCRTLMKEPATASRCDVVADTVCLQACKDLGYMPTFLADHFIYASEISWTVNPERESEIQEW